MQYPFKTGFPASVCCKVGAQFFTQRKPWPAINITPQCSNMGAYKQRQDWAFASYDTCLSSERKIQVWQSYDLSNLISFANFTGKQSFG